jgi:hypothetical protein
MIAQYAFSLRTLLVLVASLICWRVINYLHRRERKSRLGAADPPPVPYYLPFGIDTLIRNLKVLALMKANGSIISNTRTSII